MASFSNPYKNLHGLDAVTRAVAEFEQRCAAAEGLWRREPFTDQDRAERRSFVQTVRDLNEVCTASHGVPLGDGTAKRLRDRINAAMNLVDPD